MAGCPVYRREGGSALLQDQILQQRRRGAHSLRQLTDGCSESDTMTCFAHPFSLSFCSGHHVLLHHSPGAACISMAALSTPPNDVGTIITICRLESAE